MKEEKKAIGSASLKDALLKPLSDNQVKGVRKPQSAGKLLNLALPAMLLAQPAMASSRIGSFSRSQLKTRGAAVAVTEKAAPLATGLTAASKQVNPFAAFSAGAQKRQVVSTNGNQSALAALQQQGLLRQGKARMSASSGDTLAFSHPMARSHGSVAHCHYYSFSSTVWTNTLTWMYRGACTELSGVWHSATGTGTTTSTPTTSTYVPPPPPDTPPEANNVAFTGTLTVGTTLTGSYDYFDFDYDSENGSSYQWYRSTDASGTSKTAIPGATGQSYTLTSDDVGQFISFEVTPSNYYGTGSSVESALSSAAVAAIPTIDAATYDASTGVLTITGSDFVAATGANNDIDLSTLTVTGQGGGSYTLTTAADVEISSATSFSATLSGADKTAVDALLNQDGTSAQDATVYNLAAAEDWLVGVSSALTIADLTGNAITVSGLSDTTAPALTQSNPAHGATGVSNSDPVITLTFDENVQAINSANNLFRIIDNTSSVVATLAATSAGVTISGPTVTLSFVADLEPNAQYGLRIDNNALSDTSSNNYAGLNENSLRFTTANDAPVANNDSISTNEDNAVQIAVLDNDTDNEGYLQPSSVTIVSAPNQGGATSINTANGVITYTPLANFNGVETFSYQVSDEQGGNSNVATVTVTVAPINDKPELRADLVTTKEDSEVLIDVLANDIDIDDSIDASSLSLVSNPKKGSVTVDAGKLRYIPKNNVHGSDSFTYVVADSFGAQGDVTTVSVNISSENDAPQAGNDEFATDEDSPIIVDVLVNDSDIDSELDATSVTILNGPNSNQGSVSVDAITGAITFTPAANFNGSAEFNYIVKDQDDAISNAALVTITVNPVNDAPVAMNDSVVLEEDMTHVINVLGNDKDVEDGLDASSVVIGTAPEHGAVSIDNTTGQISYTPAEDFYGDDSFTYTVKDIDDAISNSATVSLSVQSINDLPLANDDSFEVDEDSFATFDLLTNDSDIDGSLDSTSVTIVSAASSGTTQINNDGTVTYTPAPGYVGSDSFDYRVQDNESGTSNTATVSIMVNNTNDAPNVDTEAPTIVDEDSDYSYEISASDLDIGYDSDEKLTITSDDLPEWLTLIDNGDGTATLTGSPNNDMVGEVTITLVVTDSKGATAEQSFTLIVANTNDAPEAVDDEFNLTESNDGSYRLDVLANDFDIDGDSLRIQGAQADIGEVRIEQDQLIYLADSEFLGTVELVYSITDGKGGHDSAVVSFTIGGTIAEQAPTIEVPDDVRVDANALFTRVDVGTAKAVDRFGIPIAVSLIDSSLLFPPGNSVIYWQATDSEGLRSVAEQRIAVTPLVSLSKDQIVVEGSQVQVQVLLNGEAPEYPVMVPYTVSGTADELSDHDLQSGVVTIASGTQATIDINIADDMLVEGDETLIITLDAGQNRGHQSATQLTISEANVAPEVELQVQQDDLLRNTVAQDEGTVIVHADISDANGDILDYIWQPQAELLAAGYEDGQYYSFDPALLAPGVYQISFEVDDGEAMTNATTYIEVTDNLAPLGDQDSDGDLIPDNQEGYRDSDGDGIADYMDAIDECNVMPLQVAQQRAFLVEGDPGVCLRKGSVAQQSSAGGLKVENDEIEVLITPDLEAQNIGGVFDYIAYDLPEPGQNYRIVVPQQRPIPAGAVMRKFTTESGWSNFIEDSDNALFSAQGETGVCPPPGGDNWQPGLNEGHWCVQMQIKDGGPNDADGIANGTIVDPSGVGVISHDNQLPQLQNDSATMGWNDTLTLDVLSNDSDADGDYLSITSATANFGQVSINSDDTLTYVPNTDFAGVDTVIYSVSDGNGGTNSAQVTITVEAKQHVVIENNSGGGGSVPLWAVLFGGALATLRRYVHKPNKQEQDV